MWTHHISRDEGMINSEIVHCEEMIKVQSYIMQSMCSCKILFAKDISISYGCMIPDVISYLLFHFMDNYLNDTDTGAQ